MKPSTALARPIDDYDPQWVAFWQQNPHLMRSVGAAADEGEDDPDSNDVDGAGGDEEPAGEELAAGEGDGDGDDGGDDDEEPAGKKKPSDKEATLLKEVMEKKKKLKESAAEIKELKAGLRRFEGIDVDEVKNLLADKKKAEGDRLEKAGEFLKVKERMAEEHQKAMEPNRLKSTTFWRGSRRPARPSMTFRSGMRSLMTPSSRRNWC